MLINRHITEIDSEVRRLHAIERALPRAIAAELQKKSQGIEQRRQAEQALAELGRSPNNKEQPA